MFTMEYTRDTIYFFKGFIVSFVQTFVPLVVKSTVVGLTTKVSIEYTKDTIYFFKRFISELCAKVSCSW